MNQENPENRNNPYTVNPVSGCGYHWDPSGKKLAVFCRILSFICRPVLWLILAILVIWKALLTEIVTPAGILWFFLSILILLFGVQTAINNLFVRRSRRLSPEGRHDFLLYRFHHVFRKNKKRRAESLLRMAELDLRMHHFRAAESALREVDTEVLTARHLKYYDFLWMALELLIENRQESSSAQEWYIRFAGINAKSGIFPDDAVIQSWIGMDEPDRDAVCGEILKAVEDATEESPVPVAAPLVFLAMAAHCVFYFAASSCLRRGWHLQPDYSWPASSLTCLFVIALGVWILYLFVRTSRRENGPAKGGRLVLHIITGILWICFIVALDGVLLPGAISGGSERVIARNVGDTYSLSGKKYNYIAVDLDYGGTEYFRAQDPVFMEEWQEAAAFDQKAGSAGAAALSDGVSSSSDGLFSDGVSSSSSGLFSDGVSSSSNESHPDGVSPSGNLAGPDSGEGAGNSESDETDSGFAVQNAMQRVFSYLEKSGVYPDLAISFDANAKGDLYALIFSGSENKDGKEVSFELCLYDNGEKDTDSGTEQEIVLEKVYPSGDYDTELLGFYLVNTETGEVTDEHKTSW